MFCFGFFVKQKRPENSFSPAVMNAVYLRNHFKDLIQLIIPRKRINFLKYENGELVDSGVSGSTASFACLYYCYKIRLPRDILWL